MTAVIIHSDFGAQEKKIFHCFHCFNICLPWSDGIRYLDLIFWMLSFKLAFSFSSFIFIKRLFSSSSLSAVRVVVICISQVIDISPSNLIPACVSSSPVFSMMHSACKLNKQGDSIQPWCTPFPALNHQSLVPCLVLTVASWPAYSFLRRQAR